MSTTTVSAQFAPVEATAPRKSIWRRFFDALVETQQRRADREIARFLESHGGLLTDDMERQIMANLSRSTRRTV
jgi:hypothetical protein